MTAVKICGVTGPENLSAAAGAGARFVGFVFYPPSPRALSFDIAWTLAQKVPTGLRSVGLFVDPDDDMIRRITGGIPLDMIQLHGDESPGRVAEIKAATHMPVIKAVRIAGPEDLQIVAGYEAVADWLLFDSSSPPPNPPPTGGREEDAKASEGEGAQPGGTGQTFDWSLLEGRTFKKPWMLAGGLTAENVGKALKTLRPDAVDVSSGVEKSRGVKDPAKIKAFIEAVNHHDHAQHVQHSTR